MTLGILLQNVCKIAQIRDILVVWGSVNSLNIIIRPFVKGKTGQFTPTHLVNSTVRLWTQNSYIWQITYMGKEYS